MIASTAFSVIFLLVIVTKTSTMDLATAKKGFVKPLYDAPHVDNQNSVPKITMSIYYESLSSDSVDLFKNQIRPILAKFQKYVNFDFVPFGNADKKLFEGRWFFKCQNGLTECMKNKWQACSIHVLPSKLQLLANYLVCYMSSTVETHSGYQCTRNMGLYDDYYGKIKKCFMNRQFSDSLMVHYSNRTQTVLPRSAQIPSIVINGVYSEIEQDDAKNNLGNVLCKYIHPKVVGLC
ncbi:PREDICTED: gamma-interferon-inducible lysosomal thiol reductase-like [Diuraphis noxia]|uniref:gamma-interferon-inducible lysosomal thiol reductase-like n=1 Tax=Diuraphis noxia TaxID=143948 RepID=UPI000763A8EB|nr:PREDICTED: gamma-interferon-inducible lysosomal thiol reductase-like [Diuraphis noxia]